MQTGLSVHGSIFFLLKKYIDHSFGLGECEKILEESKSSHSIFEITKAYPFEEISGILNKQNKITTRNSKANLEL